MVVKNTVPELVPVTPDLLRAVTAEIPDVFSPVTETIVSKSSGPRALAEA